MKKYQNFSSVNFQFLEVKFSIYLNRRVFVMRAAYKLAKHQPSMVVNLNFLFNFATVSVSSDWMTALCSGMFMTINVFGRATRGSVCGFLVFWLQTCHYENMPIEICWKFYHQNSKIFRQKIPIFFIFLLKT